MPGRCFPAELQPFPKTYVNCPGQDVKAESSKFLMAPDLCSKICIHIQFYHCITSANIQKAFQLY